MLKNNDKALLKVKELESEKLLDVFKTVKNYDSADLPIDSNAEQIVVALKNEDIDGMLGIIYRKNPYGVTAGAIAAGKAAGINKITYIARTDEEAESLKKADPDHDVIVNDFVNKKLYPGAMFLHPCYLAAFSDKVTGEESGVILSVDGKEPQEVMFGTPWMSLLKTGASAYSIGHRFFNDELINGQILTSFIYGSGVVSSYDDEKCIIQAAAERLGKLRAVSCGKCTLCREGLYQLECIFNDAQKGRASNKDIELVRELSDAMSFLNNCSLGLCASLPAISVLNEFSEDVNDHFIKKKCRSGKCTAYNRYYIDGSKCKGCGSCSDVCPQDTVEFKKGYTSVIDDFACIGCGKCLEACKNDAIKLTGNTQKITQKAVRIEGTESEEENTKTDRITRTSAEMARLKRKARLSAKAFMNRPAENAAKTQQSAFAAERSIKEVKKIDTDIVIIAGGPAGLAAAVAASEKGAKTVLFDKANSIGGAANMGMGPLGIDTKIQKANFNNISVEYALKKHMEYTHYRVDEDLVSAYFHKSADTIEWLQNMGVEFFGAFRYFKESEATWHIVKSDNGVIGPRAAGKMAKILSERAKELGTQFYLETAGTDLIVEDGKVVGAIAVSADGTQIEARAKAVIVATGGFIGNKQMVEEELGLHLQEDFFPFHMPGLQGDGLKMMWKAGAAKFGINIEAIYQIPDNATWGVLDGVLRQPNLLINQFGDRFMDEGDMGNTTYTGNAIHLQPGNYAYCIMDRGILREYQKNGPDIVDLVHSANSFFEFDEVAKKAVEQNYMGYAEASTVAELAEKIGMDPEVLQYTIDEYNEMCENGVDTKFHKERKFLRPITGKGNYICGKFYLGAYGTIGGVRINRYGEVLDENMLPIEGLYAAGTDANTIYGDSYNFTLPGNSMGFAVNTGRMAGEAAADFVLDN